MTRQRKIGGSGKRKKVSLAGSHKRVRHARMGGQSAEIKGVEEGVRRMWGKPGGQSAWQRNVLGEWKGEEVHTQRDWGERNGNT